MLGHTLSLYILHSLLVNSNFYWPNMNIQGAKHINMTLKTTSELTHEPSNIALITPKLHLPAPPHEPIHHLQAHSLTISQDIT